MIRSSHFSRFTNTQSIPTINPQDHLASYLLSQDQCREMAPGITACTEERKFLVVSVSKQEDSSGIETATSKKERLDSLQRRANMVVRDAGLERSRENAWRQSVEQHRAEHHEKKQRLRRHRLAHEADQIQDAEPMHISPFNALPHFEYLYVYFEIFPFPSLRSPES